jgi:peptidoglycan/LPS O-acetylase OafA/YrhL
MEKNSKVQILRALSIITVILIHTCPGGLWQVVCRPFINFGVAMFIFLSGYLTKIENDNWIAFYKKRIIRVLIPYIIWSILYTISNGVDVTLIIFNLITTKSSAQLYYVFVYIQFVILTPLLGKLIQSKYRWIGWLIAPVSMIVFRYYWLFNGIQINKYVSTLGSVCCLSWFSYYYLGLLLGNKIKICTYSQKKLSLFCIISIALQMVDGYGWLQLGEANCGTQIKLTSFLTSTLCILLAYKFINNDSFKPKSKLLVLIGDCSFGIYLSHMLIMKVLLHIPYYSSIPYVINSIMVLIISLICVIIGKKICGKRLNRWLGLI